MNPSETYLDLERPHAFDARAAHEEVDRLHDISDAKLKSDANKARNQINRLRDHTRIALLETQQALCDYAR